MRMIGSACASLFYGAVAERELRVISRLKRHYVLRCAYVLALALLTLLSWNRLTRWNPANAYWARSQMSSVGGGYLWLQFIGGQFLIIVLLSGSINREISKKTLGVLMTTPLTGLAIAWEKLLSRLLPTLLILCLGFPLLALFRVFGGLPWTVVVASLCVTLTAVIFSGTLALLVSVFVRQPFSVVTGTVLLQALWPSVPAFLTNGLHLQMPPVLSGFLAHSVPMVAMVAATRGSGMGGAAGGVALSWLEHCGIMLSASLLLLLCSAAAIRRAALGQAQGQVPFLSVIGRKRRGGRMPSVVRPTLMAVRGPVVAWKEACLGCRALVSWKGRLTLLAYGMVLVTVYVRAAANRDLEDEAVQTALICGLALLGFLRMATVCAMSIPKEKESRTWPLLLVTPLTGREIVLGKVIGALWLTSPLWLLLGLHVTVFVAFGYLHPAAIYFLLPFVGVVAMAAGAAGLYVGVRVRRASTAAATVVILLVLSGPNFCCPIPTFLFSPVLLLVGLTNSVAGNRNAALSLGQLLSRARRFSPWGIDPCLILFLSMLLYLFMTWICLTLGENQIRQGRTFEESPR